MLSCGAGGSWSGEWEACGGLKGGLWPNGQAGLGGPRPLGRKWPLGKHGWREMVSAPQHPLCSPRTHCNPCIPHTTTLHPSNWSSPHPCIPGPFTPPASTPCLGQPHAPPNLQPPLPGGHVCPTAGKDFPPTPPPSALSVTSMSPWCPQGQAGWRKAVVGTCGSVTPIRGTTGRGPPSPQVRSRVGDRGMEGDIGLGSAPAAGVGSRGGHP